MPTFVILNLGGNHTIHPDPVIKLTTSGIGCHVRTGKHTLGEYDWHHYKE